MYNELVRMRKEKFVVLFKLLISNYFSFFQNPVSSCRLRLSKVLTLYCTICFFLYVEMRLVLSVEHKFVTDACSLFTP
jgi:hypothetical protein